MKNILQIIVVLTFLSVQMLNAQKTDKAGGLKQWMSKFYTIGNLKASDNGRYVMINTTYKSNNDTVLVFDSTKPKKVIHTFIKRPQAFFLDNERILALGNGKAELLNLESGDKIVYENVQRAGKLENSHQYFIMDKAQNLSLYHQSGKIVTAVSNVLHYTTDKKSILFVAEKREIKKIEEEREHRKKGKDKKDDREESKRGQLKKQAITVVSEIVGNNSNAFKISSDSKKFISSANHNNQNLFKNSKNSDKTTNAYKHVNQDSENNQNWYYKNAVYSTENEITKLELTSSGKYLMITEKLNKPDDLNITEKSKDSDHLQITFIEDGSGDTATTAPTNKNKISQSFSGKADFITVTEIRDGKSYLIDFDQRIPPQKNEMVDIWYGTDKNLRKKKYGTQKHGYQLWNPETDTSVQLPTDRFSSYAAIGSERYLLAFNTEEEFYYVNTSPVFPVYLYDTVKNSYRLIFSGTSNITGSSKGEYILGFEKQQNRWILYDMKTFESTPIEKKNLRNPVFTDDSRFVFFESNNDLWKLDLKTKRLTGSGIAEGKEVRIMHRKTSPAYMQYNASFETAVMDIQKSLVLKIRDKNDNLTSYLKWNVNKGQTQILIPPTHNRIKDIQPTENSSNISPKIFTIEENYNQPPVLYQYSNPLHKDSNKKKAPTKTVLFRSNKQDTIILKLKQEVLSYTNSIGTKLKGLLYYPIGFNPKQKNKYPMVVRIYQQQAVNSGVYPLPGFDEDGFNLRLLLENGYFVFLPDIVFDERGTGVSALDCINSGLDQLVNHPHIDQKKIGLTGHSLGGYETNFIAIKSDRFAAYISGASVSNLLMSYFSYNTHFNISDYARYENGQFEMNVPFSENKDLYFQNNPMYGVEKVSAPMLLWAGLKDENVTPDQTMAFYMGLLRNRKPVIALLYHHKGHDLGIGSRESEDLNLKTLNWWNYFLKDQKNIPWIEKEMNNYQ